MASFYCILSIIRANHNVFNIYDKVMKQENIELNKFRFLMIHSKLVM